MNFYEHHLGDYMRDTAHLSMLEDAAYRRLLDVYYVREKPLPVDPQECCRLARAFSPAEKSAVKAVLGEFFTLLEDGHHQARADLEIARYSGKEPERAARRENEKERQRRSRERRKSLFDALRQRGVVPDFYAPITELEAVLSRVTGGVTDAVTSQPVTCDNTASQSPVPSPHFPVPSQNLLQPSAQTPRVTPSKGEIDHARASEKFEQIKRAYPKFAGRQDWLTAQHACFQRIERDGCTWESLRESAERYARYCSAGGVSGPKYVITPGKFFSDADKPWSQNWDPPPTKADTRLSHNLTAAEEFMRRTEPNP